MSNYTCPNCGEQEDINKDFYKDNEGKTFWSYFCNKCLYTHLEPITFDEGEKFDG